jgi:hypothetical protein
VILDADALRLLMVAIQAINGHQCQQVRKVRIALSPSFVLVVVYDSN